MTSGNRTWNTCGDSDGKIIYLEIPRIYCAAGNEDRYGIVGDIPLRSIFKY